MKTLMAQAVGVFLVMVLCFFLGYSHRDTKATKETLALQNSHMKQMDDLRAQTQGELNEISKTWQGYLSEEKSKAQRTIADLTDTGYRLRIELADARVCNITGDCGPEPIAKVELHPRASEFLVRQAQRADAQVEALQAVVKELQGGPND